MKSLLSILYASMASGQSEPAGDLLKLTKVDQVTEPRHYYIVFDLNGVLVHRGAFKTRTKKDICIRPGARDLLS